MSKLIQALIHKNRASHQQLTANAKTLFLNTTKNIYLNPQHYSYQKYPCLSLQAYPLATL